jgi:hypothetical protein
MSDMFFFLYIYLPVVRVVLKGGEQPKVKLISRENSIFGRTTQIREREREREKERKRNEIKRETRSKEKRDQKSYVDTIFSIRKLGGHIVEYMLYS